MEKNNLNNPIEINSVINFLEVIFTKQTKKNMHFYYRGEEKDFPKRLPSLYRNEMLVNAGSEYYYRSLINELGRTDYVDGSSLFQLLSELQHYEAKTRMLDVTSNPLVALYFAIETQNEEDGYVYLFEEDPQREKFDTGHTVAIKSALNLISQDKINIFLHIMSQIVRDVVKNKEKLKKFDEGKYNPLLYKSIDELLKDICNKESFLNKKDGVNRFFTLPINKIMTPQEYNYFCKHLENLSSDQHSTALKAVLKQKVDEFLELLTQRAKSNEQLKYPIQIYLDLYRSHIVLTSKRTDRLRQQQGAFIYPVFPPSEKGEYDAVKQIVHESIMEKSSIIEIDGQKYTHIKIPKEKKTEIKKELALIGIDEGFIYPDIKHRSNTLLAKL